MESVISIVNLSPFVGMAGFLFALATYMCG